MVKSLVEEGALVGALDVAVDSLVEHYADTKQVFPLFCDMTDKISVEQAVTKLMEHFQKIDVLFCNVMATGKKSLLDISEEEWRRVMNMNLNGTFLINQAVFRQMYENQRKGRIVNICSLSPEAPHQCPGMLLAGKGAVMGLAHRSILDTHPCNIHIRSVDGIYKTTKEIVETALYSESEEKNGEIYRAVADQPFKSA